jgi:Ion channel
MKWLSDSRASNLIYGVIFVLIVAALAVVGYMLNGWSFGDSLFMVVLTIFTVGYDEVHPLDTVVLRAITIPLIVLGCTGMIYLRPLPTTRINPGDGVTILGRGGRANVLNKFSEPSTGLDLADHLAARP